MLAVDNQATGLLFIHDNIRRRIDAHRAFRAPFPRSARTRSAPPVHLVASQPALPRHTESPKPRAFGVLVGHISQFTRAKAYVWTLCPLAKTTRGHQLRNIGSDDWNDPIPREFLHEQSPQTWAHQLQQKDRGS